MMTRRKFTGAVGALLLLGAVALASTSCAGEKFTAGEQCNDHLDSCAEDEVCWPTTTRFQCLPHDPDGGLGSPCANVASDPQCAHGLSCYAASDVPQTGWQCSPRCESNADCQSKRCVSISVRTGGDTVGVIRACQP